MLRNIEYEDARRVCCAACSSKACAIPAGAHLGNPRNPNSKFAINAKWLIVFKSDEKFQRIMQAKDKAYQYREKAESPAARHDCPCGIRAELRSVSSLFYFFAIQ